DFLPCTLLLYRYSEAPSNPRSLESTLGPAAGVKPPPPAWELDPGGHAQGGTPVAPGRRSWAAQGARLCGRAGAWCACAAVRAGGRLVRLCGCAAGAPRGRAGGRLRGRALAGAAAPPPGAGGSALTRAPSASKQRFI
ncbi:unnamed protein product, partial [Urochloa humidicola]